jgi:hypothetical protein
LFVPHTQPSPAARRRHSGLQASSYRQLAAPKHQTQLRQLLLNGRLRRPNLKPGESFSFLTASSQIQQQDGAPTKAAKDGHCWQQSRWYVVVESSRSLHMQVPPNNILTRVYTGKSSLTVQFVDGHFVDSYYPTIENTFSKMIKYKNQDYATEIIDTAGQVREVFFSPASRGSAQVHAPPMRCFTRVSA